MDNDLLSRLRLYSGILQNQDVPGNIAQKVATPTTFLNGLGAESVVPGYQAPSNLLGSASGLLSDPQPVPAFAPKIGSIQNIVRNGETPVYHDTSIFGAHGILDSGSINASQPKGMGQNSNEPAAVSVTRDFLNHSRYADSPYRFVISKEAANQKSQPYNLMNGLERSPEAEEQFSGSIPASAIRSLMIDMTNPATAQHIKSGDLQTLIAKAQDKGLPVEFYRGRPDREILPETQGLLSQ